SFYDASFHGANWNAVGAKYRPLVKHVALKEDLYSLISLMLGELNASHLGISGDVPAPEQATAELGLLFDNSYKGDGLRIAEVLRGGTGSLPARPLFRLFRQGGNRARRPLQRRRLHPRAGPELSGRQGAYLFPPARRRLRHGSQFRRSPLDQTPGAAHQ